MQCQICNAEFELKSKRHPFQRFCSNKCIKTNYRQNHKEKDAASKRKYSLENKDKRRESTEKYRLAHKEFYREYSSLRGRHLQQAKPSWADTTRIKEIYKLASEQGLEVDHIIPLKHDLVCGLHVPANLQLLTRSENARKSNKFDEDIVCVIKGDK